MTTTPMDTVLYQKIFKIMEELGSIRVTINLDFKKRIESEEQQPLLSDCIGALFKIWANQGKDTGIPWENTMEKIKKILLFPTPSIITLLYKINTLSLLIQ